MIDAALLRPGRFDELLHVPPPDAEGREVVLAIHAKGMPIGDDVDLASIAARCDGWSGAQLSAICREAGMLALRESLAATEVRMRHFEAAWRRVHASPTVDELAASLASGASLQGGGGPAASADEARHAAKAPFHFEPLVPDSAALSPFKFA